MAHPPASQLAPSTVEPARRTDAVAAASLPVDLQLRLMRGLPNPRDRSLSKQAIAWFERVPEGHRPAHVFDRYPRIANRIALCWGDKALSAMLFRDLLGDRRGGRRGFPAAVKYELLALQEVAKLDDAPGTAVATRLLERALPEAAAA